MNSNENAIYFWVVVVVIAAVISDSKCRIIKKLVMYNSFGKKIVNVSHAENVR